MFTISAVNSTFPAVAAESIVSTVSLLSLSLLPPSTSSIVAVSASIRTTVFWFARIPCFLASACSWERDREERDDIAALQVSVPNFGKAIFLFHSCSKILKFRVFEVPGPSTADVRNRGAGRWWATRILAISLVRFSSFSPFVVVSLLLRRESWVW